MVEFSKKARDAAAQKPQDAVSGVWSVSTLRTALKFTPGTEAGHAALRDALSTLQTSAHEGASSEVVTRNCFAALNKALTGINKRGLTAAEQKAVWDELYLKSSVKFV